MTIDKAEHREWLLQILNSVNIQGSMAEALVELKATITAAAVEAPSKKA